MNDTQLLKTIEALAAKCVRLEARCDALDVVLCALAMRSGIPKDRVATAIDRQTAKAHQTRLERVEDLDPGTGASLDRRPLGDDLLL